MIVPRQTARYIELADGTRVIDGLGFPPRRISRRQQIIQSAQFAIAFVAIACLLLFGAY